MACNGSEGRGGGPPCLPHSPRHPNTVQDPATADPPPRLPNIARKTPPPLTCPITAHKTPTTNLPRFFNTAPKTPPTRHTASTQHSRPCNHQPPCHPNTARKTCRPEHKTPPTCHSCSHAEVHKPPSASLQITTDAIASLAAITHDRNHDGHEHVAGNELGFCPSHVAAVAPNLHHMQVHHHHPAVQKPRPNAMRSRHVRPATTGHVTPTQPRHRQPTSTPPLHSTLPTPRYPDKARQTTPTHRHTAPSTLSARPPPLPRHPNVDHSTANPVWISYISYIS
ncbi:hypothetical protein EDB85DRAFT_1886726 [Lactarius pseudohatsudake]|nr:hypothetical protein EDB85DRAFT_1886726 [Lactarius pseudohatsudake]